MHSGKSKKATDRSPGRARLLARLARDTTGNTLAIVGAALLPLAAMIGSGVDMSRAYMAQNRLQTACDAASLAGRRVMENDTLSAAVIEEARRYFEFNFPDGTYGTADVSPTITRPAQGTVRVAASTTIPTAIMHLFGFESLPLDVTCDASLNFVNTDVMLVLDVTGSMMWDAEGNETSNDEERRITALREAVMALYDELEPIQTMLEDNDMRLRYGILPFSSTVNVGALLDQDHIADRARYQSRVPIYIQWQSSNTYSNKTRDWCDNQRVNLPLTNITFPVTGRTTSYSGRRDECTVTTSEYDRPQTSNFGFWYYEEREFDTSEYKAFDDDVPLPTRDPGTSTAAEAWNGCIEERTTVATIDENSGTTIPAGATDLEINRIPDSEETRWRPMWQQVVYHRRASNNWWDYTDRDSRIGASASGACPTAAEELQQWTEEDLEDYVESLNPVGSTYHDIGLLWGARMISSGGVFAASPDTFNGMPVRRHIIFMTDGELAPSATTYSSYGIEYMDQRVTGSNVADGMFESHRQRFRMICNALRGMDVSVWVIAFGTDLSDDMRNCASNPNQASMSENKADLIARFREIGNQIGALRLTQ